MTAYLTARPPVRQQWYPSRNRPLTGCTVLHDAENVMDTLGADTGAENVVEFIRTRTTPGSYHDLVDSDSGVHVVEYRHAAFHDGTGSNNWALSLSFACRTVDWSRMSATKRRGFLWQGAFRFAAQQQWRKANKAPLTRLRYITRAQSDAGESGFCCHGWRDPGRRTDPGTAAPHLFPFDEWLAVCAEVLAALMPDHPDAAKPVSPPQQEDDEMNELQNAIQLEILRRVQGISFAKPGTPNVDSPYVPADSGRLVDVHAMMPALLSEVAGLRASQQELVAAIGKLAAGDDIDVDALVQRIEGVVDAAVAGAAKLVRVQVSVDDANPA